jgi:putative hydrolase of the HAD superfamily
MARYVLWDFDGTIAMRSGMWSDAMLQAIARHIPDSSITLQDIRPHLCVGFPWHEPDRLHDHLSSSPSLWWEELEKLFRVALQKLGHTEKHAATIAACVKSEYLDLQHWRVAPGVPEVFEELSDHGWGHVVVSNHVPELQQLVESLGIDSHFERIFSSALLGVEKPNPIFFQRVLSALGPRDDAWIVGDSVHADISGGKAAGLKTVLVGGDHASADACITDLRQLLKVLGARS